MRVLRAAFFLLLLGNLLLFAWGKGYLGASTGAEAERLAAQIEPDKLRIVGVGALPKSADPPREECRAFAGLDRDAAGKLVELFAGRDEKARAELRTIEEPVSWWVHIPPQPNGAQADRKAAELSKLGIKDFYVVREKGANQFAISLGLFRNEEGANDYLAQLQKKNVKTARILAREAVGDKVFVEVRGTAERLARISADLPAEYATATRAECMTAKP